MLRRDRMRVPAKRRVKARQEQDRCETTAFGKIWQPMFRLPHCTQPSMLKAPPSPGLNDSSFDANTEMADIDRRLNALQDFLKEAKNGNISVDAE